MIKKIVEKDSINLRGFIFLLVISFLVSCKVESEKQNMSKEELPTPQPEAMPDTVMYSSPLDDYKVELAATKDMRLPGEPGVLEVWIGGKEFSANFYSKNMVTDSTYLPAIGESAIVMPFAPNFTIEPAETQCIKIHPSGSHVRFKITPQKSGSFTIGADVELFETNNCSGPPVPQTAKNIDVTVTVDNVAMVKGKLMHLLTIVWDGFINFWVALVALIFGVILFLIKGKLKKWFGYTS